MILRIFLIIVLFGALSALLITRLIPLPERTRVPARGVNSTMAAPRADEDLSPFGEDSLASLDALRERVAAQYRLRPDRRLIGAFADVAELVGAGPAPAEASWNGASWTIRCGGRKVGTLPEHAGFEEADALLAGWTRRLVAERGFRVKPGGRVDRAVIEDLRVWRAAAALRRLDRAWTAGARDVAHLSAAAEGAARLAIETVDRVGAGDAVASRALAVVALAREIGAPNAAREMILLAHALDYASWAAERAAALPAGDPVRLYVTRDEPGLTRAARASTGLEAAYLELLRLSARTSPAARQKWLDQQLPNWNAPRLPVIATGLEIRDAEGMVRAAFQLIDAAGEELAPRGFRAPAPSRRQLGAWLDEFERVVSAPDSQLTGPFLPQAVLAAHERALCYSAFERAAEFFRRSRADVAGARWFGAATRPKASSGPAAEFHRWYALLLDSRSGRANPDAMIAQLDSLTSLGGSLPAITWMSLVEDLPAGDVRLRRAARTLARGMDARPINRIRFGVMLRELLQCPTLGEPLLTGGARCLGRERPEHAARAAVYAGDRAALAAVLGGAGFAADDWDRVLGDLSVLAGADSALLRTGFERAIALHPKYWKVHDRYVRWLDDRRDYGSMRRVAAGYLEAPGSSDSWFDDLFAKSAVARACSHEGRWEDGLRAIGELDSTNQFGAMQRKALLLQGAGRAEDALALAVRAHLAYPDLPASRFLVTEVFWAQGRYGDAADMLKASRTPITLDTWGSDLGPAFERAFRGRPGSEAVTAAESLFVRRFNVSGNVGQIAFALAAAGDDSTAFEIQSRIPTGGLEYLRNMVYAYGSLLKYRSPEQALAWLHSKIPVDRRLLTQYMAFERNHDELLWDLECPEESPVDEHYAWLLRAAAAVRARDQGPRRAGVLAYLREAPAGGYLDVARYLMGLIEERDALAGARTTKQRCELYFFAGLKAESEGRTLDACDWYTMNRETGSYRNGEAYWASYRLVTILGRGVPIVNPPQAVAAVRS